jgi:hypothetical protein
VGRRPLAARPPRRRVPARGDADAQVRWRVRGPDDRQGCTALSHRDEHRAVCADGHECQRPDGRDDQQLRALEQSDAHRGVFVRANRSSVSLSLAEFQLSLIAEYLQVRIMPLPLEAAHWLHGRPNLGSNERRLSG